MPKRVLTQHIAVFGESGSGKTVLLSSFYGLMREKPTQDRTHLDVVPDDAGQGDRLLQNYLGMSRDGRVPQGNRFSATSYSFTAWLDHRKDSKVKPTDYDAIRLVWHDYPGEWFHESPSGPEEAQRRANTFRALLESDVAVVLIDGEKLAKNSGNEDRYLKLLFTNVRNGLLPIISEIQDSGKPLARFPRIWMLALSKADVLPNLDATELRNLVVLKAAHEVDQLRTTLERVVLDSAAMSVGEDFVLLSSAKFSQGSIDITKRVGVDLMMPIATVFPLERFLRWAQNLHRRGKVAQRLLRNALTIAGALGLLLGGLLQRVKVGGPIGTAAALIASLVTKDQIDHLIKLADDQLEKSNKDALAKGDYLRAALAQFRLDIRQAEQQAVLFRSRR